MFWFHEFHFLLVAYLIGGVLKCMFFFFQNPGIGTVLHMWSSELHIFYTNPPQTKAK